MTLSHASPIPTATTLLGVASSVRNSLRTESLASGVAEAARKRSARLPPSRPGVDSERVLAKPRDIEGADLMFGGCCQTLSYVGTANCSPHAAQYAAPAGCDTARVWTNPSHRSRVRVPERAHHRATHRPGRAGFGSDVSSRSQPLLCSAPRHIRHVLWAGFDNSTSSQKLKRVVGRCTASPGPTLAVQPPNSAPPADRQGRS